MNHHGAALLYWRLAWLQADKTGREKIENRMMVQLAEMAG